MSIFTNTLIATNTVPSLINVKMSVGNTITSKESSYSFVFNNIDLIDTDTIYLTIADQVDITNLVCLPNCT